jgi:hypothetical protein
VCACAVLVFALLSRCGFGSTAQPDAGQVHNFHKVLYAGAASHVSRSFECTIHVFGCAGFPTTALSCPRAIALTTALRDTHAACAASLTDRYPAAGRCSSTGPRAFRCMPLTSAPLYPSFTRRLGEPVVSPPSPIRHVSLIGVTTLGAETPPIGQSWRLFDGRHQHQPPRLSYQRATSGRS